MMRRFVRHVANRLADNIATRVSDRLAQDELASRDRLIDDIADRVSDRLAKSELASRNRLIDDVAFRVSLELLLKSASTANKTPFELFAGITDEFWFWLNSEGYRTSAQLRTILPSMPAEELQLKFTGATGDTVLREAFLAYVLFRKIITTHLPGIDKGSKILDFGCGWGRVLRFFLKDFQPTTLFGADAPAAIDICKQTNPWCHFEAIDPLPPFSFPDESYDVVYCYSVFSHLSEESHGLLLGEFRRIMKRGGLLIITVRPREFIEQCTRLAAQDLSDWKTPFAGVFTNTSQHLADYDSGKYCYSRFADSFYEATVGAKRSPWDEYVMEHWGEACIPKDYVMKTWSKLFTVLDFVVDPDHQIQNVVTLRK